MLDENFLRPFVGHRVELRPAAGRDAVRDGVIAWPPSGNLPLTATVVGITENLQLRIETDDMSVLRLKDRAVYADPTSSATLFRIQGMLEVVGQSRPTAVCTLTPFDHAGIWERRQWVRVPTVLTVRLETSVTNDIDGTVFDTVSVDLSGGGIKLRSGPRVTVGSSVSLVIDLPTGCVEVRGEVLEDGGREGVTRVRFLRMFESAYSQIVRHVFDVQREIQPVPPNRVD